MARLSLGGELYEVVDDWEFSGRYEWKRYATADVHVMGPQIGRYLDRWYLRLRTSFVERDGSWVIMQVAAARYYLGAADAFVEGQVGYGRNVELVAARPAGTLRVVDSYFGTVRVRHFFGRHVGASLSATYSDASVRRMGLSVGLLTRW
jgi:YaiO family outer membrane protein